MSRTRPAPSRALHHRIRPALRAAMLLGMYTLAVVSHATTTLADQPLFTQAAVPGNLVLALSVEYPTAVSVAHTDGTYSSSNTYLGYFDPNKCYSYSFSSIEASRRFLPAGTVSNRTCTGTHDSKWSGNFLNWATMQTIDPFRWVLTGGYRVVDSDSETVIEKAWASGQGGDGNFPNRSLPAGEIAGATPFTGGTFNMRIWGLGNQMRFSTGTGDINADSPLGYSPAVGVDGTKAYTVSVRVKVCDAGTGTGGVESNCKLYPNGNHKPEGLIHQYAEKIRYSAFGYLNDGDIRRDGGVLRARQKFVGPKVVVPGSASLSNTAAEWYADTGVFLENPDAADATATQAAYGVAVANSGVINYLNKFGQIGGTGTYKTFDPVGELYYAALRYLKNQGNVASWSAKGSASADTLKTWVDGFPVITSWDDPVQYSCQRNFVLGVGDVNTHADKNVPGSTNTANEPGMPPEVTADTRVNSVTATHKVGELQGLGSALGSVTNYNGCCSDNAALMAGLAYDANTVDIRPDDSAKPQTLGKQTVQTYWLDVLEYQTYKKDNQFYLAAKYGGFKVPLGYSPYTHTTALPESWWRSNTDTVGSGSSAQPRPDNYFTAARPDQVVDGLTKAFASIAASLKALTTSFATPAPQVALSGNTSYSAQFDSATWTGDVQASEMGFNADTGTPSQTLAWSFSAKLGEQAAGAGWDTGRRVVTFNTTTSLGVPFRSASLSTAQLTALDTPYRSGVDGADYVNYLRGDRLHEQGSSASGSSKAYRTRTGLLGDVAGSKARPVGPPNLGLSNASNPGYGAFKSTWATRPTVVYFGANDGMLHAVNGALSGTGAGTEIFAYVPSAVITGPTGSPGTTGLAALGNPTFVHRQFVNATPTAFDIDFNRTAGRSGAADWRTVLIGGLGKGGRSWYALDVTDPAGLTSETAVAAKVLWEFTDADMGYSYGEPLVVKTAKYGWVVILGSGYNNSDGKGYLYLVNPRTGALLEKIGTGEGSPTAQAGLAHVNAFVLDRTDGTADAAYAGDLLGNIWRLDLTPTSGNYAAPLKFATLTSSTGAAQPVSTRPLIETDPRSGRRFVLVGTGLLLDESHISSSVQQSFYAIVDGTARKFAASADLPSGISFPVGRSKLADNTNLTNDISYDMATQIGWTIELGSGTGSAASIGWRVVSEPGAAFGIVTFASTLPNGDACNPAGSSRVYAVNFGTGKSVLVSSGTNFINYYTSITGVVTDLRFFSVGGSPRLIAGSDSGDLQAPPGLFNTAAVRRQLNWREVPVGN